MVLGGVGSVLGFVIGLSDFKSWGTAHVSLSSFLWLFIQGALIGLPGGIVDKSKRRIVWGMSLSGLAVLLVMLLLRFSMHGERSMAIVLIGLPIIPMIIACSAATGVVLGQVMASTHPRSINEIFVRICSRAFLCICICAIVWASGVVEGWYQFFPAKGPTGYLQFILAWFAVGAGCYVVGEDSETTQRGGP